MFQPYVSFIHLRRYKTLHYVKQEGHVLVTPRRVHKTIFAAKKQQFLRISVRVRKRQCACMHVGSRARWRELVCLRL